MGRARCICDGTAGSRCGGYRKYSQMGRELQLCQHRRGNQLHPDQKEKKRERGKKGEKGLRGEEIVEVEEEGWGTVRGGAIGE